MTKFQSVHIKRLASLLKSKDGLKIKDLNTLKSEIYLRFIDFNVVIHDRDPVIQNRCAAQTD